ncbi:hypothetical protein B0H14DRAFT_557938 [Mycena olivaceomarginata]|nr:hypothetical protein B0H14DRAFT_557938 [Mycena olivaceomarginata]
MYLRTSTVYTSAPPRLTIDPGYCASCPAASGLDRVAVAIPLRAAFRLPLKNKVSLGEGEEERDARTVHELGRNPSFSLFRCPVPVTRAQLQSHPQGHAPPLHAGRNQNTHANRACIALISIRPSIPAPSPSLNTFTFPPVSLPPPILSPSTGTPSLIPSHHPTPLHPQRGRVGALLPCSPVLASDFGARREIGVDWEVRGGHCRRVGIGRTSWWVREGGIVSEVGKGDEREGREEEQMVGNPSGCLPCSGDVESSRVGGSCVPVERVPACFGFGSEGKGTRIKWDGAKIASFATARLLLDYLLCVASAFSFARPASRF